MPTTLVVTNDFPPRIGGIESFVRDVCGFCDDVVVLASAAPGGPAYDRTLPFEVIRTGPVLLPTPAATRLAVRVLRDRGADRVLFGAAMPLGLMAGALRRAGAERLVGLTHGHEAWWATLPGSRHLLRGVADRLDVMTTISDHVADRLRAALPPAARARLVRLPPPVDTTAFRPGPPTDRRPRCVTVGRLVTRKNVAGLLHAWTRVLRAGSGPDRPELVVVGDGPQRVRLERLSTSLGIADRVRFLGALPRADVAEQLRQATVFALPVRTRLAGLDAEGLGLATLEAAACGLPVVVGNSGGAPETVVDGLTGFVVDGSRPDLLAGRLRELLDDPARAHGLGQAGRARVVERFGSGAARRTVREALGLR